MGFVRKHGIDPIVKGVFGKDPLSDAIFGKEGESDVPKAPAAPDRSDAEIMAAQEEERRRRSGTGRAGTMLTRSGMGEPETATKKLLGA